MSYFDFILNNSFFIYMYLISENNANINMDYYVFYVLMIFLHIYLFYLKLL